MNKTTTVRARIQPELKEHAETVFARLGMSSTQAITMFYKQVEIRNGLPFDVVIPTLLTEQTLKLTDTGRDLTICTDAKDLFNKLGI